jgi:hypothetical protein
MQRKMRAINVNKELERMWKKQSLNVIIQYPYIWIESLRKTTNTLSQDWLSALRDSNQGPPEYEARVRL